ncbi:MAG TPA: amidohydrolase family protein [Burkholderiaceae bacterium]|nr:amidohydrolase family protein [Burkholderiaceae bacterium]
MKVKRRDFMCLCCALPIAAALARAGEARAAEEALRETASAATTPLPASLARHELVAAAWEGLDPSRVWDAHAHLIGTGDSGGGAYVDPRTSSWLHPVERVRRWVMMSAAGVDEGQRVDAQYIERLHSLLSAMPAGFRMCLFAFDAAVDEQGREAREETTFFTPNEYAAAVMQRFPERFEWVASVHPYRPDAIERLERVARQGARAIKWLPSAMNIDPSAVRCDPFYARLAALGLPLIVHCGEEFAAPGARKGAFNNPLLLRRPLEAGVRVIVAHAASLGGALDLDRGRNAPAVPAFDLFARLMDDVRYERHLFADVSAVFQRNRDVAVMKQLLRREAWHARLLQGSDYPLPGIRFVYAFDRLVEAGLLQHAAADVLQQIRAHNPLLFEFVLKRTIADGHQRFSTAVFHTRDHLDRAPISAA